MNQQNITPDFVRSLDKPCQEFLCSPQDNIYGLNFQGFKIRDVDKKKTLFEFTRSPEMALQLINNNDDNYRQATYYFTPEFFQIKTIGTAFIFGIGDKPLKNLLMIERHYFLDTFLKNYEFSFPFCIPNSINTCEAIYDVPALDEEIQLQMIMNPCATKCDTFYFVDNHLIMHQKSQFDYCSLFMQQQMEQQMEQEQQK